MAGLIDQGISIDGISGALGWVLYAVVMKDLEVDPTRPMLSAVALPKNESSPKSGFYNLAIELGRLKPGEDELAFWLVELSALRSYWQESD